MCDSRAVPSGKVYRQLFDAQVQLSRSLLVGRRDTRTDCLSAEDSNTRCSTTSRLLCPLSSRGQQDAGDDDDAEDVIRLPDSVVVDRPSSDIIQRLTERKSKKHKEALTQLDRELEELTQVCEKRVRTVSVALLSSLGAVDQRLNILRDRMEHLEHFSLKEVCALWQEVEEEVNLKKSKIMKLKLKLTKSETQRTDKIRVVLRKYCHLLEKISFLLPPDVCRLIHTEATMMNQSLLANRRSVARLLLLLQEENLQQESVLRLHWDQCVNQWRTSRVTQIMQHFRSVCSSEEDQQLISDKETLHQMKEKQQELSEQRRDLVYNICSLVPPSCSTALVSDWFNQLSAVNQQIDSLHTDFLHQLRCCYEQKWQNRLAEVERCKLSDDEVNDLISSQLLNLIGRGQSQDEERLEALDLCCDSVARRALTLSRSVFVFLRGAALLWEMHSYRLARREEELQNQLDDLRRSQHHHIQKKKGRLDDLLGALRQESGEEALRTSLDKTVRYLQELEHSYSLCVCDQFCLLERLPSLFLEELVSYSSSLGTFHRLKQAYRPSPDVLKKLMPDSPSKLDASGNIQKPEETENPQISSPGDNDSSHQAQDWLNEAQSSLLELCDIRSVVMFTSSRGSAYHGPAFRSPASQDLGQETQLIQFPVDLLTHSLSRTRTLYLDHLEQRFHDVIGSAVSMVTERKEAVRLERQVQLTQLDPEHIQTHIYTPRRAELQLHRQRVDVHCSEVSAMLSWCRAELKELQNDIITKNREFTVTLTEMEEEIQTADNSQRLEAVSSTLQDCVDEHIRDTQRSQTTFRHKAHVKLEEIRRKTSHLLSSFRLFSEGGDFSLQEVKMFQRKLKEETKQISVTEENIYCDLEGFESKSLQTVKEASAHFEEKLCFLKAEVTFNEKIHKMVSSTQVTIKAEAALSNQQQSAISSKLQELKRMMEDTQVCPEQLCGFFSSVNDDLVQRCRYLDLSVAPPLSSLSSKHSAPLDALTACHSATDLMEDPVIHLIKSLNRLTSVEESSETEQTGAGGQRVQRCTDTVNAMSMRRGGRSIRAEKKFMVFGSKKDQNTHSFSSTVTAVLWRANDILLLVAEDFYRSERCGLSRFILVPDNLDQWAEGMQQRLLGYEVQAKILLSKSREEVLAQLSLKSELLQSLPVVLIGNHERRQEAGLMQEVGGVRQKLEQTMDASQKEKLVNVRGLRASLSDQQLQRLDSTETDRQNALHSALCCTHRELQECVRVRGEEFVTSLASLTEKLLHLLDVLLIPEEPEGVMSQQSFDDSAVTIETGETQTPCTSGRTWPGISYLSTSTASITTTRCTMGHLAVIEERDSAVKRFDQLIRSESSRSDDDKEKRLSELTSWSTHWREQIHKH